MRAASYGPYVCLLLIIGLLGTVTPVIKTVFESSHVDPVTVAALRTLIAFLILFPVAACRDRTSIARLTQRDFVELSALGALGIGSYLVAATGLYYTTVTHYVLIYSLLPGWTAVFMAILRHRALTPLTLVGIALSFLGCAIAVTTQATHEVGLSTMAGDGLVLLFTIMMALHLVGSREITKRVGTLTSTVVMFGSTSVLMIAEASAWAAPAPSVLSLSNLMALGYIGAATAAVFLLRAQALKSLPPTTVASFHNLIPICTLLVADFWLSEPLQGVTLVGGAIILTGLELLRRAHLGPRAIHTDHPERSPSEPAQMVLVRSHAIKTA